MSSFFNSLVDKAQNAYEGSPLAGQVNQLQSKLQGGTGKEGTSHGAKSQTLGNLGHQFKALQMQYSNVEPVQRIVTSEKGVSLDFASVSKDSKAQSKEFYMWGQTEPEDIKDVTDRLAYLNFVHGALAGTLASSLDSARASFKALRDAERALQPQRQRRSNIQAQIFKIQHDQVKGTEHRLAELRQQLHAAESEDASAEKEVEILKRKAVRESEQAKWEALREYGEKLVLLAEASTSIVSALPSIPPSAAQPYTGGQSTAATRASLQRALDNYKPGSLSHSFQPLEADLNRSDSRSFGVTHAAELSHIGATEAPATPAATSPAKPPQPLDPTTLNNSPAPVPTKTPSGQTERIASPPTVSAAPPQQSPLPLHPSTLNNSPTPIPTKAYSPQGNDANSAGSVPVPVASIAVPEPTIAETGVPVSASGTGGPGPASGSLKDLHSPTLSAPGTSANPDSVPAYGTGMTSASTPTKYESANDEKTRLAQSERERLLQEQNSTVKYESAQEEKNRLEREEKERLLRESAGEGSQKKDDGYDGATPPPYQD